MYKLIEEEYKGNVNQTIMQESMVAGYINTIFNTQTKQLIIVFIESIMTSLGIATFLILNILKKADRQGLTTVILDDMSDNYRQVRNIYTKIGMTYVDDTGPEMEGNIKHILNKYIKNKSTLIIS